LLIFWVLAAASTLFGSNKLRKCSGDVGNDRKQRTWCRSGTAGFHAKSGISGQFGMRDWGDFILIIFFYYLASIGPI
jgi:hypothetical protein